MFKFKFKGNFFIGSSITRNEKKIEMLNNSQILENIDNKKK